MFKRSVLSALVFSAALMAPLAATAAVVPALADAPVCRCSAGTCHVVGEVIDTRSRPIFGARVVVVNPWTGAPYATFSTDQEGIYAGAVPVPVQSMVIERVVGQEASSATSMTRCTAAVRGTVDRVGL